MCKLRLTTINRHDLAYKPTDKALDVVRQMRYLRPAFELRQTWHYNNLVRADHFFSTACSLLISGQMYMLGQHLITVYSGISYPSYIQERIFNPLNMNKTTFSAAKASQSGKLTESWTSFGRLIPSWFPDDEIDLLAGAGGIISNVEDMVSIHQGVGTRLIVADIFVDRLSGRRLS